MINNQLAAIRITVHAILSNSHWDSPWSIFQDAKLTKREPLHLRSRKLLPFSVSWVWSQTAKKTANKRGPNYVHGLFSFCNLARAWLYMHIQFHIKTIEVCIQEEKIIIINPYYHHHKLFEQIHCWNELVCCFGIKSGISQGNANMVYDLRSMPHLLAATDTLLQSPDDSAIQDRQYYCRNGENDCRIPTIEKDSELWHVDTNRTGLAAMLILLKWWKSEGIEMGYDEILQRFNQEDEN